MIKINDLVRVKRGEHISNVGKVLDVKKHDCIYTSFTLCKIEFNNVFEWINLMYLEKI